MTALKKGMSFIFMSNKVFKFSTVMAMKEYSIRPRSQKLEPHHQMQFSVIPEHFLLGNSYPFLGEYSQNI